MAFLRKPSCRRLSLRRGTPPPRWDVAAPGLTRSGAVVMARRYSKKASKKVEKVMRERKRGTLRSGRSGKKVTSRKQAIAIGLSEARRAGAKVPKKKGGGRKKKSSKQEGITTACGRKAFAGRPRQESLRQVRNGSKEFLCLSCRRPSCRSKASAFLRTPSCRSCRRRLSFVASCLSCPRPSCRSESIGLPAHACLPERKPRPSFVACRSESVGPPAHACLPELKAKAVLIRDARVSVAEFPE